MIFIEVAGTIGKIQPFLTAKMLVFEINKLKAMNFLDYKQKSPSQLQMSNISLNHKQKIVQIPGDTPIEEDMGFSKN